MTLSGESQRPAVSTSILAVGVYMLYGFTACAYAFCSTNTLIGLAAVIGVTIAHVKAGSETDRVLQSHYRFQIGTFWIGLLLLIVGSLLCFFVVGVFVLAFWFIWSLVRIVKGLIAINERRPIAHPNSWLFG